MILVSILKSQFCASWIAYIWSQTTSLYSGCLMSYVNSLGFDTWIKQNLYLNIDIYHLFNKTWKKSWYFHTVQVATCPMIILDSATERRRYNVIGWSPAQNDLCLQNWQVQIEKKGENKSREEIFYQMKGFLFKSVVTSVFCKSARCP